MIHKLNSTTSELNSLSSNNWLSKTFSSLKEATNKKDTNLTGILRRDSAPPATDMRYTIQSQRSSSVKEIV